MPRNIAKHFDGQHAPVLNDSLPGLIGKGTKTGVDDQVRRFICKTITGYARQRRVALAGAGARALYASDAILVAMDGAECCNLYAVARRVVRVAKDIEQLAPGTRSRFYNHYTTVIAPLVSWCVAHVDRHS